MKRNVRICPQCSMENPSWRFKCEKCEAVLGDANIVESDVIVDEAACPVQLKIEYPERLSRLLLFVKWLFAIPLYIGLGFYGIGAFIVTFLAFWAILFIGRYPEGMFDFVRGYLEYQFKTYAYFPLLMSDSYLPEEVNYDVESPERLSRLVLVFLKLPSFLLSVVPTLLGLVLNILIIVAIPIWWVILLLGKYPRRLFEFNARLLEWVARVTTWQWLMRDEWSLFGTTRPVQIAVVVGLIAALSWSVILYIMAITSPSILALWFGGQWYGGQWYGRQGEAVVTQLCDAGRESDIEAAVELIYGSAITHSDIEAFISQNPYLFEGFESVQCTGWQYEKVTGQPAVLELQGILNYQSGSKGEFYGVLVNISGEWKIGSISIYRPPE